MTIKFGTWQPIATAPKDGSEVLVFVKNETDLEELRLDGWVGTAMFDEDEQWWAVNMPTPIAHLRYPGAFPCEPIDPLYWMPMPDAPSFWEDA